MLSSYIMDWSYDKNAHNAITTPILFSNSTHLNSLNNVGLNGGVSIGKNYSPSAPYIYKNQSPIPPSNGFGFYNKKNIFK